MKPDRRRLVWISLYAALVVGLPGIALIAGRSMAPRTWAEGTSAALGFQAFVILLMQFALVSRLASVSRAFGSDALTRLHRNMALLALVFVVAHALLLGPGRTWRAWNPLTGTAGLQAGALAIWVTVLVIVTSVARRWFRLSYEAWQVVHLGGSCAIGAASLVHILQIGADRQTSALRVVLSTYAALFLVLLLRYRLIRPLRLAHRPWRVVSNDDAGGSIRLLKLCPEGHPGFSFAPGQFAWLCTGSRPLLAGQHPLSLAGSDRLQPDGAIDFAVKALGDWSSRTVPALAPGDRVFVDGPFGAFTPDAVSSDALVLIAGGIGIAPMRSMLLSLRDRGDRRRVVLLYAAANLARAGLRQDIDALARDGTLTFEVVYVLERPDASWTGERGFITKDLLQRRLPPDTARAQYFVCGPVPMMDAVEAMLLGLGVPPGRIHSERYQMV